MVNDIRLAELLDTPQVDKTFARVAEDRSKTLAVNFNLVFKGYAHQGELYVLPHNAGGARLFVNGKELDLGDHMDQDHSFAVDISHLTVNGMNTVQVSALRDNESTVRVQAPWPTIIESEAGTPLTALDEEHALVLERLGILDTMIEHDIMHGFPGAQLCVVKDGQILKTQSYGYACRYDSSGVELKENELEEIEGDTLFDLASLTKMFASNLALQKLVYEKKVSIDDRVSDHLPTFSDPECARIKGKETLTIRQLLEHQAGFQPDTQFFDETFDKYEGATAGVNTLFAQDKKTTYKRICEDLPLSYAPGTQTQYSDTDYMIIGFIIERITGMDLDRYVETTIYQPLGLDRMVFNPLRKGFSAQDVAATELDGNGFSGTVNFADMRSYTLRGEVHDPKAWYCMDGVSGHAGLFGTAHQLAVLGQLMLNGGGYGPVTLFDNKVTELFVKPKDSDPTFGLGWRREATNGYSAYFSNLVSNRSFGHTGWTGTLVVIDPDNDLVIAYMTNKLNAPMANPKQVLFGGTQYLSGQLGMVPYLVCSALRGEGDNLASLFCAMVRLKLSLIGEGIDNSQVDRNVLLSLVDTLKTLKGTSNEADEQEIAQVLREVKTLIS